MKSIMPKPKIALFIPCFVDQIYPDTGFNMVKVLEHLGCEVDYNPNQTCCGQPAYNAGYFDEARPVAKKWMKDMNAINHDAVVSPSASCIGMVKNAYSNLFEPDQSGYDEWQGIRGNTYEFTDYIINHLGITDFSWASFPYKVTYHDSCSALRELNLKQEPRKILESVQGLDLIEMDAVETCCGFGGTFAVKFEPISVSLADQKINRVLETEAEYIVSTDWSCLMHLQGYVDYKGYPIKSIHIADILVRGL